MDSANIFSVLGTLSKEEKIQLVSHLLNELSSESITAKDVLASKDVLIPVGIFDNEVLGSLEAIVKFLHENSSLRFSRIARLLNRDARTVWSTYSKASKKLSKPFKDFSKQIMIPSSVFSDRNFSTLECLVAYLKDLGHSNHEVAVLLQMDDRTIWTVYDKVKKKRGRRN